MKKLTLFLLLNCVVFLVWCSMSDLTWSSNNLDKTWDVIKTWNQNKTQNQTCSIDTNKDCKSEWLKYEILSWNYTWNQDEISNLVKNFDDLNIVDNSYWYLTKQAWKQELILWNEQKLYIKSGNIILKKDWKEKKLFGEANKDKDLWGILGLDQKAVALFWPYKDVFKSWDVSFAYITKSSYWDSIKQYLYSLSDWKLNELWDLLYHNQENTIIVWAIKTNWKETYNYKNLFIYKAWSSTNISWTFDSISFDWNNLYFSKNDLETNLSDVWSFDITKLTKKLILSKKNIWQEWKFYISNWVIYTSFGVIDFVNDSVSHHIAAYNQQGWELLWEVKLVK